MQITFYECEFNGFVYAIQSCECVSRQPNGVLNYGCRMKVMATIRAVLQNFFSRMRSKQLVKHIIRI